MKIFAKNEHVKFAQTPHLTQSETLLLLISLASFLSFRYLRHHHGVAPPPLTLPLNEYFQSYPIQMETTPV